ncbi:putative tRNA-dihydrouridine synthase [Bienertia sinuspersici]
MECAEGVGRDDVVDDVIVGNECDDVYDVGSYAATRAGLEELDVEQCVGESNIEIRRGSVSVFNIDDNATQRGVSDTTNVDGVVTPTVGSVYNSWEEVERMFKAYEEKKGFGVIRGQSAYYGGTENKRAMTMRCECYGCPDMKIKNDEKKRKKHMEIGGCSGEELMFRRRRKSKKCSCPVRVYASLNRDHLWEIRKVTLEHIGHNPEPGQAKFGETEKEADEKGHKYTRNLLTGIPLEKYFQLMYTDAKFRAFQRKCERLMYCYVKEEIPNGDHMYSYVIEDRAWKAGKGGIHEYLTPKRRMYNCVHNI